MNLNQIIKYEGNNSTFVWKHDCEDFNTSSQLIVHESQEALFFSNGQACDLFGPGRYSLRTENIPILKRLKNIPTGGETPFHCEVYFINKVEQMAIKWGTDSKVEYLDPQFRFPLKIGASGDMSLKVDDSRKLLVKLVGTEKDLSQERLTSYFRGILMLHVKTYIAQVMRNSQISIFEVDEHLQEFSSILLERLKPDFLEYGISLQRFTVTTIVKPDGETNYERYKNIYFEESIGIREERLRQQRQLIQQETDSQKIIMESQAIAQKRKLEGYTYQQERSYDVAEKVAQNEGAGNFTGMGMGIGMMGGVAGGMGATVAGLTAQALSPISNAFGPTRFEPINDGEDLGMPQPISLKDDSQQPSGSATVESMEVFEIRLAKLERLKGKIPDEMYQAKLKEIMDSI